MTAADILRTSASLIRAAGTVTGNTMYEGHHVDVVH
jgi:hypothetical protein